MENATVFAHGQLKALIERIERLEEGKKAIAADIKEIYAEGKCFGFDTKIMRKVVSLRKREAHEVEEEEALIAVYCNALGMIQQPLPLDKASETEKLEAAE